MSLYGEKVAGHAKNQRNQGALEKPDAAGEGINPLCGDKLRMQLRLADGRISAVRFQAEACMISIAAASILSELLPGMSVEEARAFPRERLLAALETELRPSRVGCAALSLQVLQAALK
jgi:nitrogen fixation protein NifU and related proteins